MTTVEHYFENLLLDSKDISGEPNKNDLSPEVQKAVEECAAYIKSIGYIKEYSNNFEKHCWNCKYKYYSDEYRLKTKCIDCANCGAKMADIELVIKVDEKDVDFVRKNFKPTGYSFIPLRIQTEFVSAILNGVPVPKGHGDLKDAEELKGYFTDREGDVFTVYHFYDAIANTSSIVEADKEGEK